MAKQQITPDGKPMRVLYALARAQAEGLGGLREIDVFRAVREESGTAPCHAALAILVTRGLAIRVGAPGHYRWSITAQGEDLVVHHG
jgi:hypothetical protein